MHYMLTLHKSVQTKWIQDSEFKTRKSEIVLQLNKAYHYHPFHKLS